MLSRLRKSDGRLAVNAAFVAGHFRFLALFVVPLIYFFVVSFWTVRARIMRPAFSIDNYVETINRYGDVLVNTLAIAFFIA